MRPTAGSTGRTEVDPEIKTGGENESRAPKLRTAVAVTRSGQCHKAAGNTARPSRPRWRWRHLRAKRRWPNGHQVWKDSSLEDGSCGGRLRCLRQREGPDVQERQIQERRRPDRPPVPGDRPAEGEAGFLCGEVRSMSPARRRQMVDRVHPSLSLVRQCALLGVSRSSLYYRPRAA